MARASTRAQDRQIVVRLPASLLDRLDALLPRLKKRELAATVKVRPGIEASFEVRVTRSLAARLALELGVQALEAEK